jgi:hypothetical protein
MTMTDGRPLPQILRQGWIIFGEFVVSEPSCRCSCLTLNRSDSAHLAKRLRPALPQTRLKTTLRY